MDNGSGDTKAKKLESNKICDYCKGCPDGIDGNCLEYDRFRGKRLTYYVYHWEEGFYE